MFETVYIRIRQHKGLKIDVNYPNLFSIFIFMHRVTYKLNFINTNKYVIATQFTCLIMLNKTVNIV